MGLFGLIVWLFFMAFFFVGLGVGWYARQIYEEERRSK